MNLTDGIVLGLVQAVALIPGISRSGSTITFGIFRGLERETAARFSFLLSIPAIAGAAVLKAADMVQLPAGDLPALGAGFLSAAVTGFFCPEAPLCDDQPDRPWPLCLLLLVCRGRHTDHPGYSNEQGNRGNAGCAEKMNEKSFPEKGSGNRRA